MDNSKTQVNTEGAKKSLINFVVNNPDLELLEARLEEFNIFEAIGVVSQELRHSDFLAFLLNPQQSHGLGDRFAKRLLQKVLLLNAVSSPITPIDLDVWSLDAMFVLREWQNIDILLLDEPHTLAIIVENKIGSSEHRQQLQRYQEIVRRHYPDWKVMSLFLTPGGDPPSDERYIRVDYGQVCDLLEDLAQTRASTLGTDVLTLIKHYTQMLRRRVLDNSEIRELCQRIYQRHQRALDLIYEYRPDRQATFSEFLAELVAQTPGLILDHRSKGNVYFVSKDWEVPILREGTGWTRSRRILLYMFDNRINNLKLKLYIGPGPQVTRRRLLDVALAHRPPFNVATKELASQWNQIYTRTFLTQSAYDEASDEELTERVRHQWSAFLANDFPAMNTAIVSELQNEIPTKSTLVEDEN